MNDFKPLWWAKNTHLQTIIPVLFPLPTLLYQRERWATPDEDFLEVDWINLDLADKLNQPLLVLFHGLEGSSQSHYAKSIMTLVKNKGWTGCVVHFRTCSGNMNIKPTFYHAGFSQEIDWVLKSIASRFTQATRFAVGVSLGGNMLLKWLGENKQTANQYITKAATVCAPHDLTAGAAALAKGFMNSRYSHRLIKTLKQKGLKKLAQFPNLSLNPKHIAKAKTFYDIDSALMAPLHGFASAQDYWKRCSSKPFLKFITIPTLILNALDDSFVPAHSLAQSNEVSENVVLLYTSHGGHVGFMQAIADMNWMPQKLLHFLSET